jgi:hypothetical protein
MTDERTRDNARRLAGVLHRYAEDPAAVKRVAAALNYYPPQLQEDMESVLVYLKRLEAGTDDSNDSDY